MRKHTKKIAIIGAGPSCLYLLKHLLTLEKELVIEIFEKTGIVGAGMPYSAQGATPEHITNVSGNEIPPLVVTLGHWLDDMAGRLPQQFLIDRDNFTQYHVVPRLLFGQYLADQFKLLVEKAASGGKSIKVHLNTEIIDLTDCHEDEKVELTLHSGKKMAFDYAVVCSGHRWPQAGESSRKGYFLSPYPPAKLALKVNHAVAVKGSSLTAIDAIRTLARHNGSFEWDDDKLRFIAAEGSAKFRIVMHSRSGLLPAIRFHLRQPELSQDSLLTEAEIEANKRENGGFLSLDFVFDHNFKKRFQKSDPALYKRIKNLNVESFVELVMSMRENKPPFQLFREEYEEAAESIDRRKSIFWKEMLAELSFTMNYPAKYLSAEDMLRLKNVLMPLVSIVIAFVPQSSCDELFALHDAGRLDIVSVGREGRVEPLKEGGIRYHYTDESDGKKHAKRYQTYVDCSGQPHLWMEDLPFSGLLQRKSVSQAVLRFKSREAAEKLVRAGDKLVVSNDNGDYFLKVSGITINDHFQIVNEFGIPNQRIYMMAVPYIGGYNPDYSGLDFCEQASRCIVEKLAEVIQAGHPPLQAKC
ncbi:FAD-NAD(P)-binding [Dyadobacter soli]|uniref:FAD-NAD(P)-binding n=1 Tax=Dyadobacter soli TaxID=659014 RepID=A0A1G7VM11_9BACT|nr:FAD/NAD(P)-binding protein [Dyadobacter soli]SDG60803.1 FAD-NAD(P)-binding [Dyadobacter soli]